MNQSYAKVKDQSGIIHPWNAHETACTEQQSIAEERRQLEKDREEFEREKKRFALQRELEERRREQEKKLFEMKWQILEDEIKRVAAEREQVEHQRDFYRYVSESTRVEEDSQEVVRGEMFFVGVCDIDSLKKRYKELLKIYHPDNLSGDTSTIQEINSEYEKLRILYE